MGGTTPTASDAIDEAVGILRDTAAGERLLLEQLWSGRRLLTNPPRDLDALDEVASRLAATAILGGKTCTLILPTARPDRGPILFATALLAYWWREKPAEGQLVDMGTVIYVGNSAGVRSALERTTVGAGAIRLSDFFASNDVQAKSRQGHPGRSTQVRSGLPQVVVAYAPVDPVGLVRRHRPRWAAVDLMGEREAAWLAPLVGECRSLAIPVIAWTDNPLASGVRPLLEAGLAIPLPAVEFLNGRTRVPLTTAITPMVLQGDAAATVGRLLGEAGRRLLSASASAPDSRLVGDAVRAHWSLYRTLEYLPCPVDYWEANVGAHWGLHRLVDLRSTCERFEQAVRTSYPGSAGDLAKAGACLAEALEALRASNPRWDASIELCLAGSSSPGGLEVNFSSRGRRTLFLDALLARYGFTEGDLTSVGVQIRALGSEREHPEEARKRLLMVAGPVSSNDARAVQHLLQHDQAEVLTYLPNVGRLRFLVQQLADAWKPEDFAAGMRSLTGRAPAVVAGAPRVRLQDSITVTTDGVRGSAPDEVPGDGVLERDEELTRLMEDGLERREHSAPSDDGSPASGFLTSVDAIVAVEFADGWHAQYQVDQTVMVVERLGLTAKRRDKLAQELQVGDEVIAIHGQQRQSLYELLIARLHKNPAIELHLALLERWQEEVEAGHAAWALRGGTLEGLLRAMQSKGSQMTSVAGVRLWLTGGTLAPQDAADIRRLGELLERPFVVANYQRIANAASRLRGLHRGLALRLDNWLEGRATRDGPGPDPVIDEESGVRFSDFKSSLLNLRVVAVRIETGIFLTYRLGLVERGAPNE